MSKSARQELKDCQRGKKTYKKKPDRGVDPNILSRVENPVRLALCKITKRELA